MAKKLQLSDEFIGLLKQRIAICKLNSTTIKTGDLILSDNINNYPILIFGTGGVSSANLSYHVVMPWFSQIDNNGNFSGWRSNKYDINFMVGTSYISGYKKNDTTITIESNTPNIDIRVVFGIKFK